MAMNEYQSCKIGPFTIYTLQTGLFRLDGGAMFGVVPKPLWSRQIEADEKNRIPMGMRSWLVKSESSDRLYLVDTGIGNKSDEKFRKIYALEDETHNLENGIKHWGFTKEDITDVVFTHLHFDHGGGATTYNENGDLTLTFPNAEHWVQEKHWETATNPNAREIASFKKENIEPLKTAENLNLIQPDHEFETGFDIVVVNGHTIAQQLPRISGDGTTIVYAADLLPTHAHVPLPWVMGYDMYPATTLEEKAKFLDEAYENGWYIFLEHDADVNLVTIEKDGRKYSAKTDVSLGEWNM